MNLLCPSCQNPLSVPEQYAGQLMKCPLCGNNFTVPALAQTTVEPALNFTPEPQAEEHDFTPIDLSGHVPPPVAPAPAPAASVEEHGLYDMTPAPAVPESRKPKTAVETAPGAVPPAVKSPPPPPPPIRPPVPGGYVHTTAVTLNPKIVPWIAPVCLLFVLIFSFFPWVGYYFGNYGVVTQSAWGAAFGGYSVDELYDSKANWEKDTPADSKPGAGALMLLFLIFGLIPAVLTAAVVAALPELKKHVHLPPGLVMAEPWRWLILTGVTLVALLFLFLQIVTSFSIESRTRDQVAKAREKDRISGTKSLADIEEARALASTGLRRTIYLRFTFILLILAAAGAATAHWLEHRGPGRPLPRFEILW
jgi:hypothetical protein